MSPREPPSSGADVYFSSSVEYYCFDQLKVGQLHRIGNSGTDELVFIEIQTGTYFGEDDIERVSDDYER